MTTPAEQQKLNQATMDFYESGKQLAEAIAVEIKRIDEERRRELEVDYQSRCVKPVVNEDE